MRMFDVLDKAISPCLRVSPTPRHVDAVNEAPHNGPLAQLAEQRTLNP